MFDALPRPKPLRRQFLVSLGLVAAVSLSCYWATGLIGYRTVALLLLLTVSIIALLFEMLPVLTAAVLSALTWNFFFIPPVFTFHIGTTADALMFLMYFVIALLNAVLTARIRRAENRAREKEEKEKTIRLYNILFNSLSHELRTPIATIIGALDTLKENRDRLSAPDQATLLAEMETAGLRLNRQVENLLNMSRLESGMLKPKLDWCDVNEIIHTVIQKNAAGKTHWVLFRPDEQLPLINTDAGLLETMLQNLLLNALLYTAGDQPVEITAVHKDEQCRIEVRDHGNGFPEEAIPHVFEKFYRLPQSRQGGIGLGLSIVKGFAEALRGKVTLENAPGGGARFTVEFPADASYINNLKNE